MTEPPKKKGGRKPIADRTRVVIQKPIYLQVRQFDRLDELAELRGMDRSELIISTFNLPQ